MNINPKPKPPMPGGEYTHISDPGTPPLPPGVKVVGLIPVGDGGPGPLLPLTRRKKRKPLLPRPDEIAKLPRPAQAAFAARCAKRLPPGVSVPNGQADQTAADVAALAASAATAILGDTSDPLDLTLIRRDFDRFAWLARKHGWTDDTPVSPDLIGPLWPPGRTPHWAREKKKPRE